VNHFVRVPFQTCAELVEWISDKRKQGLKVLSADRASERLIGFKCEGVHAVIRKTDVMTTAPKATARIKELCGEMPEIPHHPQSGCYHPFGTPQTRHWLATGEVLPLKEG